tara:strand:+ start:27827 stop:28012 length:186 start_codon:yes stop_codon:yes gene_type:complete
MPLFSLNLSQGERGMERHRLWVRISTKLLEEIKQKVKAEGRILEDYLGKIITNELKGERDE